MDFLRDFRPEEIRQHKATGAYYIPAGAYYQRLVEEAGVGNFDIESKVQSLQVIDKRIICVADCTITIYGGSGADQETSMKISGSGAAENVSPRDTANSVCRTAQANAFKAAMVWLCGDTQLNRLNHPDRQTEKEPDSVSAAAPKKEEKQPPIGVFRLEILSDLEQVKGGYACRCRDPKGTEARLWIRSSCLQEGYLKVSRERFFELCKRGSYISARAEFKKYNGQTELVFIQLV